MCEQNSKQKKIMNIYLHAIYQKGEKKTERFKRYKNRYQIKHFYMRKKEFANLK